MDLDIDDSTNRAIYDQVVTEQLLAGNPRRNLWRVELENIATEGVLEQSMLGRRSLSG